MAYLQYKRVAPHQITLSQYKELSERQNKKLHLKAEEVYRSKVEKLLKNSGKDERLAKRIAASVIGKGSFVFPNVKPDNMVIEETELVNEQKEEYNHLQFEEYLLLKATKSDYGRHMPREQEQRVRQFQYENFCGIHPTLQHPDTHRESILVDHYAHMLETIKDFVLTKCRCLRAVIMFNGHGSEEGLALEGEKDPIPLDQVIYDIEQITTEQERLQQGFPLEIKVVFAQCWGHMHSKVQGYRMSVIHFTDDEHKFTYTSFSCDDNMNVINAEHNNLDVYAEEEKEKFDQNGGKIKLPTPFKPYMDQLDSPFGFVDIHQDDLKKAPSSPSKVYAQCTDEGLKPYLDGARDSMPMQETLSSASSLCQADSGFRVFLGDSEENVCTSIGTASICSDFAAETNETFTMNTSSTGNSEAIETSPNMASSDNGGDAHVANAPDDNTSQTGNHDDSGVEHLLNFNIESRLLANEQQALPLGIDLRENVEQTHENNDLDINMEQDKPTNKGLFKFPSINVPFWMNLWNNIFADTPKLTLQ